MPKVALAYSGRVDGAICVWYLRHVRGMRVVTFSANLGQPEYLAPLADRAIQLGAYAAHIVDLRDTFIRDFAFRALRAGAVYQGGYHLFSALARPLIVRELVQIAREEGCSLLAHGSRELGNDRIRFENSLRALDTEFEVVLPCQELGLKTVADEIRYAHEQGIPFEDERRTSLNVEQNLWGANIQMGDLDPCQEPPEDTYVMTAPPREMAAKPTDIELRFDRGLPTHLDGEELPPVKMVERLNKLAGRHGIGRYVVIEDRILPRKTREIYESPGATVLYTARDALAAAVLDKDTLRFLPAASQRYAEITYEGKWFGALREALDEFFERVNYPVCGDVRLRLFRGQATVLGVRSVYNRIGKILPRP